MAEDQKPQKWWFTIPGILTALAGIITAVTGFVIALNQVGVFSTAQKPVSSSQRSANNPPNVHPGNIGTSVVGGGATSPSPMPNLENQYPRSLVSGTEANFPGVSYKILKAELSRYNVEKLSITFTVRMTNTSKYPDNFWSDSFRLLVEGVPRSPVSDLNELVRGQSAEEGKIVFIVPEGTASVALRILHGNDSTEIPISLLSGEMASEPKK